MVHKIKQIGSTCDISKHLLTYFLTKIVKLYVGVVTFRNIICWNCFGGTSGLELLQRNAFLLQQNGALTINQQGYVLFCAMHICFVIAYW